MSETILRIRVERRAELLRELRAKFQKMEKLYGNFRYDFAITMIRYLKEKKDVKSYQKLAHSKNPADRFLVTVISDIIQFSRTESETLSIFSELLFWIVQDFGRDDYKTKLSEEEREKPTLFAGENPTNSVH